MLKKPRHFLPMMIPFFLILILGLGNQFLADAKAKKALDNCEKLYADDMLKLPDLERKDIGFTCTGLFWDEEKQCFLIGNAGKYSAEDEHFRAGIVIVEKDFSTIRNEIPCHLEFHGMRDVQGVAGERDGSIWFCSYGENKVRHIDENGKEIGHFNIKEPSGIAIDEEEGALWILTGKYLCQCSYDGQVKKKIKVHIRGQDQLFLDSKNHLMYFSAGVDYHGDSYIYTMDLETEEVRPLYVLKDSYAIEGIAIVDNVLYVLNDGYYHDAEIPVNQVNAYFLK